ncbi:MAG: hypothetical protein K0S34_25 [Bacillales bacterium]|nr:hypothetical protein [Bacillales bacterium]
MPYEAYRDIKKSQKIKAQDTTIVDIKKEFYCITPGCKAEMILVNGANSEKSYFRRRQSGDKHISIICSADGNFDTTLYDEKSFDFEKVAKNLLNAPSKTNPVGSTSGGVITGGGGKVMLSTVNQIYFMCRKYEEYNGIKTTEILADDRNYKKYLNGINGYKIVQCTAYYGNKTGLYYIMNFPLFPFSKKNYVKLNFETKELFTYFSNKVGTTNHKELIIVFGDWKTHTVLTEYIAECTISKKRQVHFLRK